MVVLYQVYVSEYADETGKIPVSVPGVKGTPKLMRLDCEAMTDEDLIIYFQDEFWAEKDRYYLKDMSGVNESIRSKLEEVLNMKEDRRAREYLDHKDTIKEKLPKRRPRNYILYRNGVRI